MAEIQNPESLLPNEPVVSNEWAMVELMGHVRHVGILAEEARFGTSMGVVFEPKGDEFEKIYFSGASVYRIRPITEEQAREYRKAYEPPTRPMPALPVYQCEVDDDEDYGDPFADD